MISTEHIKELSWFAGKIGKTIYKTPSTECGCEKCSATELVVENFDEAEHLNMMQDENVTFFDTKNQLAMYASQKTMDGIKPKLSAEEMPNIEEVIKESTSSLIKSSALIGIIIEELPSEPFFKISYNKDGWHFKTIYNDGEFLVKSCVHINKGQIMDLELATEYSEHLQIHEMLIESLTCIVLMKQGRYVIK